ncbi:MAG: alpha/beta fold hydrolase [Rhodospirillaceae bacterium]|nr:alpha/beta fold hydrolase [Rhodospirillaceae bacterium]MBT5240675.1 alpha/beta fold hydrolase [Rhodospirillaceae bacterium]MBT5565471.1 alpha/beta fold hydrolase [Rhodospirillaceae bacterium]MBT6089800.1 alpha/beta fold hydrolase [Rhodospirillaceae bacterium]MBT6962300.1 alpha/beta fold hydrolase [Rhodospirillaceae bacterium]
MSKRHIVLLPGLLCDHALWAHQAVHLADTAEVMVGDLTRDDSISDMAERILDEAPDTFALAGLSMGGYVAQEIMRQEPERVERLALVDTQARADSADQVKIRKDLIRLAGMGKFKGVTPRLLPNLVHKDRLDDPAVRDVVLEMAERVGQEAFARQQSAIMGRKDGRGDLHAIRIPTIVLCGRQDILTPPDLHQEMADAIPGARLVIVEDAAHLAPLEQPHAVTAVMRYWLG